MKLVLLSGGSGKRLWPLSNDVRSKQFLKILPNETGDMQSMVQRVWAQLDAVNLADYTVIATSNVQLGMIQNQIGSNVPLIVEPERRDTFPAIALAATYLYSIEGVDLDEVVVVLPVDPFVEDSFFSKLKELEQVILEYDADLALMGVKPTFPSEKYGYIVPSENEFGNAIRKVSHFREKPTVAQAKELIDDDALWNCGVFAFRLETIISLLNERNFPTQYNELINQYGSLPKISFDYEVVEKSENIVSLTYDGYWKDLGTWNTLTDEMESNLFGKGCISEDSSNVHIVNELDIPVAALGVSNLIIAASPDGILVADKNASPRVKEIAQFDQRPMYEERHWGWYRILDYVKYEEGSEVLTKRVCLKKGKNLSYHMHVMRNEMWTIISGVGQFVLNDIVYDVKIGDVLKIPAESKHSIKAITDLEFIEVQAGERLIEEDIVRLTMNWDEIQPQNLNEAVSDDRKLDSFHSY